MADAWGLTPVAAVATLAALNAPDCFLSLDTAQLALGNVPTSAPDLAHDPAFGNALSKASH
jgi:hypothetical protein